MKAWPVLMIVPDGACQSFKASESLFEYVICMILRTLVLYSYVVVQVHTQAHRILQYLYKYLVLEYNENNLIILRSPEYTCRCIVRSTSVVQVPGACTRTRPESNLENLSRAV